MKRKQTARLFSLLLAFVMLFGIAPTAFAAAYSDVADNAWYRTAVDYVSEHNLMAGTGGGNFEPETPMSRVMLVTVLHRIEGTPSVSGNGGFSDVPENSYYTTAVAWAAENNIVAGVGSSRFAPHNLITREQFATILYRYADVKGYDISAFAAFDGYTDASQISSFAENAMRWAVGSQIMQGSGGRLTPSGSATRAQAAAMLMRFMENIAEEEAVEPPVPEQPTEPEQPVPGKVNPSEIKLKITVGEQVMTATLIDNATTQALIERLPLTLPMMDLYSREVVYRFADPLPANEAQITGYEVGEIIYWPPATALSSYMLRMGSVSICRRWDALIPALRFLSAPGM